MTPTSMSDVGRPRDLLVAGLLAPGLADAMPGWRILSAQADLPDDADPLAGIIATDEHLGELEAAGFKGLPVVRMSDAASLGQDLVDLLADRLRKAQLDAAQARRAAALLRRENEENMRRMRMLESFGHAMGGPRFIKALTWAPTTHALELCAPVTQRLPVSTLAVAAIDLWLPDADAGAVAAISIEVLDADDAPLARLASEPVAGGRLGGWVRFLAAEPLSGPPRDLVVRVIAPADLQVALGIGTPVPDERFAAHMGGAAVADAPAAMRVWRADYLASLPRTNEVEGRRAAGGQAARQLTFAALGTPELLSRPAGAQVQDYVAAEYWAREDAVLVHPSEDGPVCAILRDVDLTATSSISALVSVANRDAPVLGFAVGACPRDMASAETWQDHIGPYQFLPPGAWGECHCILPAPIRSRGDILLSAMIAGRRPNDWSWALFRSLRIGSGERP